MPPRARPLIAIAALAIAAVAITRRPTHALHATLAPTQLWADGYDSATLSIDAPASPAPRVAIARAPPYSALAAEPHLGR